MKMAYVFIMDNNNNDKKNNFYLLIIQYQETFVLAVFLIVTQQI